MWPEPITFVGLNVKLEPLGGLYGENNQLCAFLRNTGQEQKTSSPLIK